MTQHISVIDQQLMKILHPHRVDLEGIYRISRPGKSPVIYTLYHHTDAVIWQKLRPHLLIAAPNATWCSYELRTDADWTDMRAEADLILLGVSADAVHELYKNEKKLYGQLRQIIEERPGDSPLLPILLRSTFWPEVGLRFQPPVPPGDSLKPLTAYPDQEEICKQIGKVLYHVLKQLRERK